MHNLKEQLRDEIRSTTSDRRRLPGLMDRDRETRLRREKDKFEALRDPLRRWGFYVLTLYWPWITLLHMLNKSLKSLSSRIWHHAVHWNWPNFWRNTALIVCREIVCEGWVGHLFTINRVVSSLYSPLNPVIIENSSDIHAFECLLYLSDRVLFKHLNLTDFPTTRSGKFTHLDLKTEELTYSLIFLSPWQPSLIENIFQGRGLKRMPVSLVLSFGL